MAKQTENPKRVRPVIIEGNSGASTATEDVTAAVNRTLASLKRATQAAVTAPAQAVQDSSHQIAQSASVLQRKATKSAIKAYLAQQENAKSPTINTDAIEAKVQEMVAGTKSTLKQVRDAVDPRVVVGGLAGLTAGEIVGSVVGGVAGGAVAGPAGAVVGSQVVGFSTGMLGLKLGADAVADNLAAKRARKSEAKSSVVTVATPKTTVGRYLQIKTGERLGEIVGLTSGASLGLVIAGPAGGLVGAVLGEALGGHIGEDLNRPKSSNENLQKTDGSVNKWIDRFGKNTAGEAATVLVTGSVGSIFGPGGRLIGHRIGLIVGKRVEWHKLGDAEDDKPGQTAPQPIALPTYNLKIADVSEDVTSDPTVTTSQFQATGEQPIDTESLLGETESTPVMEEPPIHFTRRQLDVLALLSQQLDDDEIAKQLGISAGTVKYHKRNIYKKLEVSQENDSAYIAIELVPRALETL